MLKKGQKKRQKRQKKRQKKVPEAGIEPLSCERMHVPTRV